MKFWKNIWSWSQTHRKKGGNVSKNYTGKRGENRGVTVGVIAHQSGNKVRKRKLRHIPSHSPDGFEWGYGGSGPADLALAILIDHLRERPPRDGYKNPK